MFQNHTDSFEIAFIHKQVKKEFLNVFQRLANEIYSSHNNKLRPN